ncbi:LacI family DNA-binding transcriptional regulator [Cohnella fermenti]|uniref:LacI family DNA-binding transcriptional regulator n=1 Tax=Cohnella fermenti TaxID=2565925 RepID=UPI001454DD88|nr:LacI family DNA-binding transcriptional regulator [Cohnella fermenti]
MKPTNRVTSFDVARRAGVSRSVVSAVLNGTPGIGVSAETREAVLEAIRELGYEVNAQARGMRTGVSHCIAVCGSTTNPLFLQALEGIQQACVKLGYHVLIYGEETKAAGGRGGLLNLYRQRRIDGILTLDSAGRDDEEWAEATREAAVPYLSIEGYPEQEAVPSVNVDYRASVLEAFDWMKSRGASLPDYLLFWSAPGEEEWAERERREAYLGAMKEFGGEPIVVTIREGDEAAIVRYWDDRLQRGGGMPALLVNWSTGLHGLLREADRRGLRAGRDFRLMALDNTLRINRQLLPSIACMEIPYAEMGRNAAERLIAMLTSRPGSRAEWPDPAAGERSGVKALFRAELFAGESV